MNGSVDERTELPRYSVAELNGAIGRLLERGFAPRFLVDATVNRPVVRKGHLWLSLSDGEASISGVVWASRLSRLPFIPEEGDGVLVVGKLNFWAARATVSVQILDLRPSLSAVLRQFERVRALLAPEGLLDPERKRPLPPFPSRLAILTSVPSSALADMLRTAKERWPSTGLVVVPIPVQGKVEAAILAAITALAERIDTLGIDALVLARGGGSREDLAVFDSEVLARALAAFPRPVVCGLGHEDDTTIADLVADHRAATPTAAMVALLPDRLSASRRIEQHRQLLRQIMALRLQAAVGRLERLQQQLKDLHPRHWLERKRQQLNQRRQLLEALSPSHLLERGFTLLRGPDGRLVRSITSLKAGDDVRIELRDGQVQATVHALSPRAASGQ